MGRFVKDVPNAVVYIGLAAVAYYFFVYDEYYPASLLRVRSEREKYLAATSGQRQRYYSLGQRPRGRRGNRRCENGSPFECQHTIPQWTDIQAPNSNQYARPPLPR